MSDEAVVEADEVRVTKSFDAENFPVPAVTFDVVSERDDDTPVRIIDEIPEEFGIEEIGFHPDYGSEFWTASGDGVVRFERTVEAGESFTTVYGVRMTDDDYQPFLSTPIVEVGENIDDVVPPESTQVVRDLVSGERDSVPGLDDREDPTYDDDEIIEAPADPAGSAGAANPAGPAEAVSTGISDLEAEIADPEDESDEDAPDVTAAEAENGSSESDVAASAVTEAENAAVSSGTAEITASDLSSTPADPVGALADAIRAGDATDEDLAVIREELDVSAPKSTEAKIDHLQSRVSDVEAYADALREFIDENGTAEEILTDLESEVSETSDEVAAVDERVDILEAENEGLRATVSDLEDDLAALDSLSEDLDRLAGDLDALDERVADVEEVGLDLEALQDDVETVREDLDDVEEWRSQLSDVLGA